MGEPPGGESSRPRVGGTDHMNGYDSLVDTSYHPYPPSRPFINTDYRRSPSRPVNSFPESNRDGILSALRNLQKKVERLEVEQQDAETSTRTLDSRHQTHHPTHFLHHHTDNFRPARRTVDSEYNGFGSHGTHSQAPPRSHVLEAQLSSAETRCKMLEKQLEYMHKMVEASERDRMDATRKTEALQQQQQQQRETQQGSSPFTHNYCTQLERIGELERDHLRLTATQTLAESKILELEKKLDEEKEHRRKLQERAINLESTALSNQILLNSVPAHGAHHDAVDSKPRKPPASKKKKKLVSRKQIPVMSEPTKHYRLNLADIPFVAGKSTTPSHAVGANVQKVLALMKAHNLALCSSLYNGGHGHSHGGGMGDRCSSPSVSSSSSLDGDQDLTDLLTQLQDEFGQLSFEHQEYMRHIHEAKDSQLREDLERELDALVLKMEAKGQQISKVRQHQQKQDDTKRQAKREHKHDGHVPRPSSAMGRLQSRTGAKLHSHSNSRLRSTTRGDTGWRCPDASHQSLNMLKDMKKLQTTLQRDDLKWV